MDKNSLLELKNVEKVYHHSSGQNILALQDISLKIPPSSLIMIYGPSGSGKSTLLKIAGLIEDPSRGSVTFNGHDARQISDKKRPRLIQENIGFILKRNNLLTYLNALENVLLPLKKGSKMQGIDLLNHMGLNDYKKYPEELSPLDQQKVALARALINNPRLVLVDEATGDLNNKDSAEFLKLLRSFKKDISIIMATNNPELIKYADNYMRLEEGKLSPLSQLSPKSIA